MNKIITAAQRLYHQHHQARGAVTPGERGFNVELRQLCDLVSCRTMHGRHQRRELPIPSCPYRLLTSIAVPSQSTTARCPHDPRHAPCAQNGRRQERPNDEQQRLIADGLATQRQRPRETFLSARRLGRGTDTMGPRRDSQGRPGSGAGFIGEHQPSRDQRARWTDQGQGRDCGDQQRLAGLQGPGVLNSVMVLIFCVHSSFPPLALGPGY